MANAVIVVDMQKGFIDPQGSLYIGETGRRIIEPIKKLLGRELAKGSKIFFTQDTHVENDKEFQMFTPHCIKGTPDHEIIPELQPYAAKAERVEKNRYSAFFNTDFEKRLAEIKPEKVIVVGDCTDICVMHTVADLRNRDYPVEVVTDCVATFDPEAHGYALQHMQKILGAKLVSLDGREAKAA
ncbi:MAG: cysteine hydrolase [Chloroflexi bacterium]|nr:cysteine hydrolase [Chloroflexota bacterium]